MKKMLLLAAFAAATLTVSAQQAQGQGTTQEQNDYLGQYTRRVKEIEHIYSDSPLGAELRKDHTAVAHPYYEWNGLDIMKLYDSDRQTFNYLITLCSDAQKGDKFAQNALTELAPLKNQGYSDVRYTWQEYKDLIKAYVIRLYRSEQEHQQKH